MFSLPIVLLGTSAAQVPPAMPMGLVGSIGSSCFAPASRPGPPLNGCFPRGECLRAWDTFQARQGAGRQLSLSLPWANAEGVMAELTSIDVPSETMAGFVASAKGDKWRLEIEAGAALGAAERDGGPPCYFRWKPWPSSEPAEERTEDRSEGASLMPGAAPVSVLPPAIIDVAPVDLLDAGPADLAAGPADLAGADTGALGGLGAGAIGGIITGAMACVLLIGGLAVYLTCRRPRADRAPAEGSVVVKIVKCDENVPTGIPVKVGD